MYINIKKPPSFNLHACMLACMHVCRPFLGLYVGLKPKHLKALNPKP